MIIGDPLYLLLIIPFALAANMIPAGAPRALVILLCSYAYYCTFSIAHLWVLLLVTAIAFAGGLLLEASTKSPWRNWLTGVLIAACFCPFLIYKYLLPLLASSYHTETHWLSTAPELLVPIGLSFYTFAAVGYLADVRLGVV